MGSAYTREKARCAWSNDHEHFILNSRNLENAFIQQANQKCFEYIRWISHTCYRCEVGWIGQHKHAVDNGWLCEDAVFLQSRPIRQCVINSHLIDDRASRWIM